MNNRREKTKYGVKAFYEEGYDLLEIANRVIDAMKQSGYEKLANVQLKDLTVKFEKTTVISADGTNEKMTVVMFVEV